MQYVKVRRGSISTEAGAYTLVKVANIHDVALDEICGEGLDDDEHVVAERGTVSRMLADEGQNRVMEGDG